MAGNVTRLQHKNSFHPEAERSATLPAHYYYDPDIARREKEEVFYKTWQFVGYRHDLAEAGSYLTATIVDQPIFVVRAKDGKLRAFYNVCMHRGHILLEGKGNVRMITCPFHAWTYDLEGSLKAAGNSENVAGFDHDDFCLPEIQVEELAHMVFVNLDANATSLRSQAPGLEEDFLEVVPDLPDMRLARHNSRDLDCNWKFVLDQNECYHCPSLHPGTGFGSRESTIWESTERGIWMRHTVRADPAEIERDQGKLPSVQEDDKIKHMSFIWFLWPNMVFLSHRGAPNFKLQIATPLEDERCRFTVDNLCKSIPPTERDLSGMDFYWDIVVPQDTGSMDRQQQGVHSRGYKQGRLVVDKERTIKSEHGTHFFDNLVWLALNGPNY